MTQTEIRSDGRLTIASTHGPAGASCDLVLHSTGTTQAVGGCHDKAGEYRTSGGIGALSRGGYPLDTDVAPAALVQGF